MVSKRSHKTSDSYSYDDINNTSLKNNPPWCSGKLTERRKVSPNWEIQSSYPLRENIWEYLHNSENLKLRSKRLNRKTNKSEKCRGRKMKLVLLILFCMGIIGCLSIVYPEKSMKLWNKVVTKAKTLISPEHLSVSEECCHRMKHLASELARKHRLLRVYRNTERLTSKTLTADMDWATNSQDITISDLEFFIDSDTEQWSGQRINLWGIIPLWKATLSPEVIHSVSRPSPGDCWPFSGSTGSLHILLPAYLAIKRISLEHVRPDTAKSAPERFQLYGMTTKGIKIKLLDSIYRSEGPAKQYFSVHVKDKVAEVIFNVETNQGNPKYTCIYRLQLFTPASDYNEGIF